MTECESLVNLVLETLIIMLISFIICAEVSYIQIKVLYDYESLE
jgi:hypothetical protein